MKLVKTIIAAAFIAGLLGMFFAVVALESGSLTGIAYWITVCACAILSGGALRAAMAAYDYYHKEESANGSESRE